jgi:hypothetical protein
MITNVTRLCGCVLLAASLTAVVSAHHSTAAYENTTIVLKQVKIVKFGWTNPHSILSLEVPRGRGGVTRWSVETGSPSGLTRAGWNRNSVKAGDIVTVEIFPARNGASVGRLAKVIFPDGRELLDSLYKDSPFETLQRK